MESAQQTTVNSRMISIKSKSAIHLISILFFIRYGFVNSEHLPDQRSYSMQDGVQGYELVDFKLEL